MNLRLEHPPVCLQYKMEYRFYWREWFFSDSSEEHMIRKLKWIIFIHGKLFSYVMYASVLYM